jgi:hypothetical protein
MTSEEANERLMELYKNPSAPGAMDEIARLGQVAKES